MYFAIHGYTVVELIQLSVDASIENIRLTTWKGDQVRKANETIAKKYLSSFIRGVTYTINKNEISLEEDGKESIVFELKKDGSEYMFKATTEAVKDIFGDLTLSPSKE